MSAIRDVGAGGSATIAVGALVPIHAPEAAGSTGTRRAFAGMTDVELLALVARDQLVVDPYTGRVFDGNARTHELLRRAADPTSSIGHDTQIPYEPYTPQPLP